MGASMRLHVLLTLLFAISALPSAQTPQVQQAEPLRIKGMYLGQTVQDYLINSQGKARYAKFDLNNCSNASNVRQKALDGKDAGPSDHELCTQFAKAAAGEKITIRLSFTYPGETTFEHGVVTDVLQLILPDRSDPLGSQWDKVLYDLTKKIGEPSDSAPVVAQNAFGGMFTYRSACWTSGEVGHPSYVCAREDRWNGLKVVLIRLSNRTLAVVNASWRTGQAS
jgi:hypothetical protein